MRLLAGKTIWLKLPALPLPQEWLFSLKCFASSMLSLYISFKIGLKHPFWAVATCYVIASPLAGAVRSKGVYRTIGTILSGLLLILTIPLLVNYRILYVVFLALWSAVCLYISLLDRTPRSYIFMMSSYTIALIGLPMLQDTTQLLASTPFHTVNERTQEIILGLVCSSIIHGLFFPQSVGKALLARMDSAIGDAQLWAINVLLGTKQEKEHLHRKLAQDVTELRLMATHLPFDTHNIRWATQYVQALHDRLATLVPIISGMENRMVALREAQTAVWSSEWRALLLEIADWCRSGRSSRGKTKQLRSKIDRLTPETDIHASWQDMLKINFAFELNMLISAFEDAFRYRNQIEIGVKKGVLRHDPDKEVIPNRALHTDKAHALSASLGIFVATLATTVFWMVTDWQYGFNAPMFACIMCAIFATQDNPAPLVKVAFRYMLYPVPIAAMYLLVIVPSTHSIEMLILVLAPFFLVSGAYLANPATAARALVWTMSVVAMLMLYDFGSPNFVSYVNGQFALLFGIGAAVFFTNLFRVVNIERAVRRLVRAGWAEMARTAKATSPMSVREITVRMTDKVTLLAPRLATLDDRGADSTRSLLENIRVNVNMAYLLRRQGFLTENGLSLHPFLGHFSAYFNRKLSQDDVDSRELITHLDRLLYQVCNLPSSTYKNEVISSLAGIRRDMFPDALFYRAAISSRGME